MAVALGNTSSASINNSTTLDFVHTLGTGSDLVLMVGLCLDAGITGSSVTWDGDGVNETLIQLRQDVNIGDATTEIWYFVNPSVASGSSEVNVVLSAKAQHIAGAVTFTGATTPNNETGSIPEAVTSVSDTVSAVGADDFVFDVLRQPGNAPTEGANQTAAWNIAAGGERGGGSTQDGADGGVMSWSWSGANAAAHTACRIPAAGAGRRFINIT